MESTVVQIDEKEKEERDDAAPAPPPPPSKKIKMSKVAEKVLVLAAMGKMRGGGVGPTDAEVALMNEAREALVGVCEGFAPSEILPKDVFGSMIDDLGLNRLKEQKLGFMPPKMSLKEKMLVSKRKMEKADEFSLPSKAQPSPHLQGKSAPSVEGRKPSQMANSNQVPISTGMFSSGTPLSHGISGTSASAPYQLPKSEIRPVVSSPLPSSHMVSSGADRPQMRSDARLNGPSHAFPAQANYSANSSVRNPSWSMQPHTVQSAQIRSDKLPVNMAYTAEQLANIRSGLSPQVTSRITSTQTYTAPPSQNMNQAASLATTHSEIGKIIQKILQPQVPEQRKWIPPSRDYMNKALTCQVCMSTVTEIESVLICDACEKGYHLKCLQTTIQKIPVGEWHCRKCLSLSNGKPLPPKYGRVMRNLNTSKMSSSNSSAVSATSSKTVSGQNEVGQPKAFANSRASMQNTPIGDATHGNQVPVEKVKDAEKIHDNNTVPNKVEAVNNVSSETSQNSLMKTSGSACFSSVNPPVAEGCEEKYPNTPAKSDIDSNHCDHSLATLNTQDEEMVDVKSNTQVNLELISDSSHKSSTVPKDQDGNFIPSKDEQITLKQSLEDHMMLPNSTEPEAGIRNHSLSPPPKERDVGHDNPSKIASGSGSMPSAHSSSDGLHVVNWIGDPVQDSEEKIHYSSCRINGHDYRVMDHVLIRFESDKLVPSKLQAMWEDKDTKNKWVSVTRCYFPGDFPEAVGRPCGLESNEVCGSSSQSTMMAGLIQSPCEVLPSRKYAEEFERRRTQQNDHQPPLYLCRWIYDETKGLFRDISY